jgi:hypothetical protein
MLEMRTRVKLESCTATYLHRASRWLSPFQPHIVGATERDVTRCGAAEASSCVGQYERQDGYKESVVRSITGSSDVK